MTVAVGVDLGTGAARALALTPDGTVLGSANVGYAGRAGWLSGHADPSAWRDAALAALAALAHDVPAARAPVAVGVGGQSPAVVATDGLRALTPLHPAAGDVDPHEAHMRLWAALAGDEPGPTDGGGDGGAGGGLRPLQAWDWVLHALGAPVQQGRWPETPVLDGFGPLHLTGTVAGTAGPGRPVAEGTPLVPGAADAYMAFWAAGVDTPGRGLDPGGRTGGIGVAAATAGAAPGRYGLRSAVPGVDILGGPVTAHGLAIEWWSRMTGRTVGDLLAAAAGVPAGARGLLALPYFAGERAPRWNRGLRAELVGLDTETDPGQVMRALVEATAFGLRHIVDELAADGVVLREMAVAGSPARSRMWSQVKADVLGVPVEVPSHPDLAAYGAALAAGAAAGWWPGPGAGAASGDWPRGTCSVLDPHPSPAYDEAYARWRALGDAAVDRLAGALVTTP